MIKRFWSTLLVALIGIMAMANNTITLSSVSGDASQEVEVSVSLANSDTITAVELSIPLVEALSYVDGSCQLNTARATAHQVSAAEVDGVLKIYVYSLSQTELSGTSGELLSFKLKLGKKPQTYTLSPEVVLSNAQGQAVDATAESSTVTLLAPELEITSPTIDYGRVPIRQTYTAYLSLHNSGNMPLTISNIYTDSDVLVPQETSFEMAADESRSVELQFSPTARGSFSANIYVVSDAINGSTLEAEAVAEPFSVNELHLSSTEGVSDSTVTLTLSMDNMEPIVAAECSLALPTELEYASGSATILDRGNGHSVSASSSNGKLKIYAYSTSNNAFTGESGDIISFSLKLNGTNGTYWIDPTDVVLSNKAMENMTSATSGGSVTIQSPTLSGNSSLDFGDVAVTDTARAEYSINNCGSAPLTIERVTFLSEGYNVATSLPLVIPVGETKAISVSYVSDTEGDFSTTMNVYTNDPTQRMVAVDVSGKFFEANALSFDVEATDDGNAMLTVSLDNYSSVVALQFDITGIENAELSTEPTKTDRLANHTVVTSKISDGHYRVLVYSGSNQSISGTSGEILSYKIIATEPTDANIAIEDIVISNANGVNKNSSNLASQAVSYGIKYFTFTVNQAEYGQIEATAGSYAENTVLTLRAVADEGYKFTAWSNGSTDNPLQLTLKSDTTITATFTVESYSLKFVIDADTISSQTVEYGAAITAPAAPEKEGYTFAGWQDVPATMPAHDVTINGSYTINEYNLIYMVDGEEYQRSQVTYGAAVTFIAEPTKDGYSFSGWTSEISNGDAMPAHDVIVSGSFAINGIEKILNGNRNVKIYDLRGNLILNTSNAAEWRMLPSGIYIVEGKKVVKRHNAMN